jgi:hypothetical protein
MTLYFNRILSVLLFFVFLISCSKDEPTDTNPPIEPELTFSVENLNGVSFDDGAVVNFTSIEYPEASLDFLVRNISTEIIGMRIEVESISGTDGSMMELCFGQCFAGVNEGTSYPSNNAQPVVYINPGETQPSNGDHFLNSDAGDGSNPVEYTFKFYSADEDGNIIGEPFRLKYRYSSN